MARSVRRFVTPSLLLLPAVLQALGCGGEPPPVAKVEISRSELELPYGRFAIVDLSWRIRESLTGRAGQLHVFAHLLDGPGNVVRTFDIPWAGGWQPGERAEARLLVHQSVLGPPLEPGSYGLSLGLYDGGGRRWPLATRGELVDRYEYRVAEVQVPPTVDGEPAFQYSPEWLDREPGRDQQVLARRWLTGPGSLRIGGLDRAGELWLRLLLPAAGDRQELVLSGEASQQAVTVGTDCGDVEVQLAGEGSHDVILPIGPGDDGGLCTVEVVPSFYLLELESGERRTVSLDGLAWSG
jgi:hypothetical protein